MVQRGSQRAWTRTMAANTKDYDVGDGPMASLLRIVRYGEGMTVAQLYERATSDGVRVHSRRHMKGLLNWMKKIGRVRTEPAMNAEGKILRGKNHSFHLTEDGQSHVAKIDDAMPRARDVAP